MKRAQVTSELLRRVRAVLPGSARVQDGEIDYLIQRADGLAAYADEWMWGEEGSRSCILQDDESGELQCALESFNGQNREWRLPWWRDDECWLALIFPWATNERWILDLGMKVADVVGASYAFGSGREHLHAYVEMAHLSALPLPPDCSPERFAWPLLIADARNSFYDAMARSEGRGVYTVQSRTGLLGVSFALESRWDCDDDADLASRLGLESLIAVPIRERCPDPDLIWRPDEEPGYPQMDVAIADYVKPDVQSVSAGEAISIGSLARNWPWFVGGPITEPCSVTFASRTEVSVVDVYEGTIKVVLASGARSADWSRDGRFLLVQAAFSCAEDGFLVDVTRGSIQRVLDAETLGYETSNSEGTRWEARPRLSADATTIVYSRPRRTVFTRRYKYGNQYDEVDVWRAELNGHNRVLLAAEEGEWLVGPCFSPDNSSIALLSRTDKASRILVVSTASQETIAVHDLQRGAHWLSWHPSGKYLAFVTCSSGLTGHIHLPGATEPPPGELWLLRLSDRATRRVGEGYNQYAWLREGREILVERGAYSHLNIVGVDCDSIFA